MQQQVQTEQMPMTSHAYKCTLCKDTGWLEGDTGYRRCSCYKQERVKRLWENFGISLERVKTINSYKTFDEKTVRAKNIAIDYIKQFETIVQEEKNNFGLFGQNGAGKTHLIVGVGAALIKSGVEVVYMPYVEAIRELKCNAMEDSYYTKLISRYQRADVLIIDDLLKDKTKNGILIGDLTEADIKHFYPILNYRYNNSLPVLFSTECTPSMLLRLDEAQCGRILERCGTRLVVFEGAEYNYRMQGFIKKGE